MLLARVLAVKAKRAEHEEQATRMQQTRATAERRGDLVPRHQMGVVDRDDRVGLCKRPRLQEHVELDRPQQVRQARDIARGDERRDLVGIAFGRLPRELAKRARELDDTLATSARELEREPLRRQVFTDHLDERLEHGAIVGRVGGVWYGNRVQRIFSALVILLACAGMAHAGPRTYAVEVEPAGDWRTGAVAGVLVHDLQDDRLVPATGNAAADVVIHARLDARALHYEVRATWAGAPAPAAGMIMLASSRADVAALLRDVAHRITRTARDDQAEVVVAAPSPIIVTLAIVLFAIVLAVPFVVGRRYLDRRALRRAGLAVVGMGAGGLVATQLDVPWLLAAGLAWGSFVATTVPVVFPPVIGFGRVEQGQLATVVASWAIAVCRRLAIVVLAYTPIGLATFAAARLAGVDPVLALALAVPLALLVARLFVRCATALAANMLDERLVEQTSPTGAWHEATRAYVIGYLRRAGLPVDEPLLARVQFLPGAGNQVVAYGGGLTTSRIVIPRRMLELALAPAGRPHDYAAPRVSTLHWTQWNAGLVVPTETDAVIATRDQRQPRALPDEGEHERQLFGEPPTLAGTIEPSDLDARPRYLPHEDRIWLDWDPGEDYDGTDPGDRDFLFGAIVHALGEIQRHGDRLATFVLLAKRQPRASALADDHAALAGARHHLAQYLGWLAWHDEHELTARAFVPELEAASQALTVRAAQPGGDARLRRRIARLTDPTRGRPLGRWLVAGGVAASLALAATAIVSAVRYHATYAQETTHG